jgi:hypothetical protein
MNRLLLKYLDHFTERSDFWENFGTIQPYNIKPFICVDDFYTIYKDNQFVVEDINFSDFGIYLS